MAVSSLLSLGYSATRWGKAGNHDMRMRKQPSQRRTQLGTEAKSPRALPVSQPGGASSRPRKALGVHNHMPSRQPQERP